MVACRRLGQLVGRDEIDRKTTPTDGAPASSLCRTEQSGLFVVGSALLGPAPLDNVVGKDGLVAFAGSEGDGGGPLCLETEQGGSVVDAARGLGLGLRVGVGVAAGGVAVGGGDAADGGAVGGA